MPWCLLSVFLLLPWFVRDPAYRCFAAVRYTLFGTKEYCRMPTPDVRKRFLDWDERPPASSSSSSSSSTSAASQRRRAVATTKGGGGVGDEEEEELYRDGVDQ